MLLWLLYLSLHRIVDQLLVGKAKKALRRKKVHEKSHERSLYSLLSYNIYFVIISTLLLSIFLLFYSFTRLLFYSFTLSLLLSTLYLYSQTLYSLLSTLLFSTLLYSLLFFSLLSQNSIEAKSRDNCQIFML